MQFFRFLAVQGTFDLLGRLTVPLKRETAISLALALCGVALMSAATLVLPRSAIENLSLDENIGPGGLENPRLYGMFLFVDGASLLVIGIVSSLLLRTRRPLKSSHICLAAVLPQLVLLFGFRFVDFSRAPSEDAAILMRYAQHFAQGAGIVWNIGEKPVDGATDFLFMIVVGCLVKAGLSLEASTRIIGLTAHCLTVVIVFLSVRDTYRRSVLPAIVSALYLAVGPGLYYVAAFFGTPLFALFACLTWLTALKLIEGRDSYGLSLLFALSGLITGLIRPEGVILAGLMLLGTMYSLGPRRSRKPMLCFAAVFAVLGGLYFAWRWQHFGYPLPNPFYKKGGGYLHLESLKFSVLNTIKLCLPFLWLFILGFRSPRTLRLTVALLIPIVGFAAAFVLLSDEMNFGARFQYALLPMVLISWPLLLEGIGTDFHLPAWCELDSYRRVALVLLVTVLSLGAVAYQHSCANGLSSSRDGRYDVALMLREYADRGYTIATTEAGLLPLYSRWRAVDAWGLNDPWIAHNGRISSHYLDLYKPQLIVFHAYFSPLVPPYRRGPWSEMVMTLKDYAQSRGYILAAVFGETPYDTHYYYVQAGFPQSTEIVGKLKSLEYYWSLTGRRAVNYALLPNGSCPSSVKSGE